MNPTDILAIVKAFFEALKSILKAFGLEIKDTETTTAPAADSSVG